MPEVGEARFPIGESMLYGSLVFQKPIFVGGYDTTG